MSVTRTDYPDPRSPRDSETGQPTGAIPSVYDQCDLFEVGGLLGLAKSPPDLSQLRVRIVRAVFTDLDACQGGGQRVETLERGFGSEGYPTREELFAIDSETGQPAYPEVYQILALATRLVDRLEHQADPGHVTINQF